MSVSGSLAIVSTYAVIFGVGYQWGYWSHFDIQFLQFAAFNETIGQSVLSAALPLAASVFGVILAYPFTLKTDPPHYFWHGDGEGSKIVRFLHKVRFIILILIVIITILSYYFKREHFLEAMPLLWAPVVSLTVNEALVKLKISGITSSVQGVIFVLALVVLSAPYWGELKARKARDDHHAKYVSVYFSNTLKENPLQSDPENRYKYIGKLGDRLFVMLQDGSVLSIKNEVLNFIRFH